VSPSDFGLPMGLGSNLLDGQRLRIGQILHYFFGAAGNRMQEDWNING
jgi:hypothetical protein